MAQDFISKNHENILKSSKSVDCFNAAPKGDLSLIKEQDIHLIEEEKID